MRLSSATMLLELRVKTNLFQETLPSSQQKKNQPKVRRDPVLSPNQSLTLSTLCLLMINLTATIDLVSTISTVLCLMLSTWQESHKLFRLGIKGGSFWLLASTNLLKLPWNLMQRIWTSFCNLILMQLSTSNTGFSQLLPPIEMISSAKE